jgi:hypothetical protein
MSRLTSICRLNSKLHADVNLWNMSDVGCIVYKKSSSNPPQPRWQRLKQAKIDLERISYTQIHIFFYFAQSVLQSNGFRKEVLFDTGFRNIYLNF